MNDKVRLKEKKKKTASGRKQSFSVITLKPGMLIVLDLRQ